MAHDISPKINEASAMLNKKLILQERCRHPSQKVGEAHLIDAGTLEPYYIVLGAENTVEWSIGQELGWCEVQAECDDGVHVIIKSGPDL